MRAATYARYSSDLQRAASIEDQLRNCKKRAESEGWEIVSTFSDAAISGSDQTRPQYRAMLAAATRGEFDVLLVDDLSRLTRDSIEQERTIRKLEFQNIRIVATSDGYDSQSKARKVHRGVKGLMNEIYIDDLRDRVHRGLAGQALKHFWCGGRVYGYALKPILDPSQHDAYGQSVRVGTVLEIDREQATIVREIYKRYVEGMSCRSIAKDLNARGVASAGSTWRREKRRCSGWMDSAVREILRNPLYTGCVRWNVGKYIRDPDTGKRVWRARPKDEWIEHRDEDLRIISDELFQQAQQRTRIRSNSDARMRSGGKPVHLLSGLLRCGTCSAHYVLHDARSYACAGHRGGACDNHIRVRRDALEVAILDPLREDTLAPDRVARMAKEMQRDVLEYMHSMQNQAAQQPKALQELDARIARLRERLKAGDPDMTADEISAAIDRAEAKRSELADMRPRIIKDSAKVLAAIPNTAELYRRQITLGLDGHPEAKRMARLVLRDLLGEIRLDPGTDGSLWANYKVQPAVLVRAAVSGYAG